MSLQVALVEEVHEIVRSLRLLDDAVVDVHHLLGVHLDIQTWRVALLPFVVQSVIQIHQVVQVELNEVRRHLDGEVGLLLDKGEDLRDGPRSQAR